MNEGLIIFGENATVLSANKSAKSFRNILGRSYLQACRDVNFIKAVESARAAGPSLSKQILTAGCINCRQIRLRAI